MNELFAPEHIGTMPAFFLYVEDDAANRRVLQMLFTKMLSQFELMIFEDSAGFLEKVKALPRKPDVFLLDIQVRPYNGYEMLAMLRADPDYKNAVVIALTASVTNEEVLKLREQGFNGAVGKPFSIATFPALIERIASGGSVWHIS